MPTLRFRIRFRSEDERTSIEYIDSRLALHLCWWCIDLKSSHAHDGKCLFSSTYYKDVCLVDGYQNVTIFWTSVGQGQIRKIAITAPDSRFHGCV